MSEMEFLQHVYLNIFIGTYKVAGGMKHEQRIKEILIVFILCTLV
jgi:hypothetical protein